MKRRASFVDWRGQIGLGDLMRPDEANHKRGTRRRGNDPATSDKFWLRFYKRFEQVSSHYPMQVRQAYKDASVAFAPLTKRSQPEWQPTNAGVLEISNQKLDNFALRQRRATAPL